MVNNNEAQNQGMPTPDPALKRLNRLVDTWSMKGHLIGSDEDSITVTTTFVITLLFHSPPLYGNIIPNISNIV